MREVKQVTKDISMTMYILITAGVWGGGGKEMRVQSQAASGCRFLTEFSGGQGK